MLWQITLDSMKDGLREKKLKNRSSDQEELKQTGQEITKGSAGELRVSIASVGSNVGGILEVKFTGPSDPLNIEGEREGEVKVTRGF